MGTNTFNNKISTGDELAASDINQFQDALNEELVGRERGQPTQGKSLGNSTYPWGSVFTNNLNVGGTDIDFSSLTGDRYSIVSGKTAPGSEFPDFIAKTSPRTRSFTIRGADTPLTLIINSRKIVINEDILFQVPFKTIRNLAVSVHGLSSPVQSDANNPYNSGWNHDSFEAGYIGRNAGNKDVVYSKNSGNHYIGQIPLFLGQITTSRDIVSGGETITTDNTRQLREKIFTDEKLRLVSFGNPANTNSAEATDREYFLARPKKRDNNYSFIDVSRRVLGVGQSYNILKAFPSGNRTLQQTIETGNFANIGNRAGFTFHELYWIFIDADNPSIPIIVDEEPIYTRASDNRRRDRKAWFDIDRQEWNFSGVTQAGRRTAIPIGIVSTGYQSTANLAATLISKSFDFTRNYKKDNTIRLRQRSTYVFESEDETSKASVYGRDIVINQRLSIEVGGTPGNGTCLYFYLTEKGIIGVEWNTPPVYRDDIKGYYHPSRSHRCIGHYVVGNTSLGISWKYSNNEKYKARYYINGVVSGGATTTNNDIRINNVGDGFLLKNIFILSRPVGQTSSRPTAYSGFYFIMRKNQLFKEYGPLGALLKAANITMIVYNKPTFTYHKTTEFLLRRNEIDQWYIVTSSTAGNGWSQSDDRSNTGEIEIEINRFGNDAIEKELWNKLS